MFYLKIALFTYKKDTFHLEKGHFSLREKDTFWVLEMGGGGASTSAPPPAPRFRRPCPQQPWSCPKPPLHEPGLLLNISFPAAPPCQQGHPNCVEEQDLFFLKQSDPLIV